MAARRLLAVAVAALLVTGAVLVRQLIRGDGDSDTTDRAGTILVCATELAELCSSPPRGVSEVIIEPAGVTLGRWSAATEAPEDAIWLTFDPFPAMLDELRRPGAGAPAGSVTTPIAATSLAATLSTDRATVLDDWCRGTTWWRCVGRAAGSPWTEVGGASAWGTVRPALGNAERDASGLLALAHATAGYFDRVDFTRSDWEADPGFIPWARRLITAVPVGMLSGGTPYATLLTRPSALDIAATTDDELVQRRPPATLSIAYPEPMMDARVVVRAPAEQSDPGGAVDLLAGRASDAGWPPPPEPPGPAPSARTMLALRQLWIDVT